MNKAAYSIPTSKFDFRHGSKYKGKTELIYATAKPYGDPLTLENDYLFEWDTIKKEFDKSENKEDLYFLKVKI